jgi:hypothetical protein
LPPGEQHAHDPRPMNKTLTIAAALIALTVGARSELTAAKSAKCPVVDGPDAAEATLSGRVVKAPTKRPKNPDLRQAEGFRLKLNPPLRASVTGEEPEECDDWNEIAIIADDDKDLAKWNGRRVTIQGKLGRFGSALVIPAIYIDASTIKAKR